MGSLKDEFDAFMRDTPAEPAQPQQSTGTKAEVFDANAEFRALMGGEAAAPQQQALPVAKPAGAWNELKESTQQAFYGSMGSLANFGAGTAQLLGNKSEKNLMLETARLYQEEAQKHQTAYGADQNKKISDIVTKPAQAIPYGVGQAVGILPATAGGVLVGGITEGPVGAFVGGTAAAFPMEAGEAYGQLREALKGADPTNKQMLGVGAAGLSAAALESLPEALTFGTSRVAKAVMPKSMTGQVTKALTNKYLSTLTGAGIGAVGEPLTEYPQTILEAAPANIASGKGVFNPETLHEAGQAAVSSIVGGGMFGSYGGYHEAASRKQDLQNRDLLLKEAAKLNLTQIENLDNEKLHRKIFETKAANYQLPIDIPKAKTDELVKTVQLYEESARQRTYDAEIARLEKKYNLIDPKTGESKISEQALDKAFIAKVSELAKKVTDGTITPEEQLIGATLSSALARTGGRVLFKRDLHEAAPTLLEEIAKSFGVAQKTEAKELTPTQSTPKKERVVEPTPADLSAATEDNPITATWRNKDFDQPVTVTGFAGESSGTRYYNVRESATAVPETELFQQPKRGQRVAEQPPVFGPTGERQSVSRTAIPVTPQQQQRTSPIDLAGVSPAATQRGDLRGQEEIPAPVRQEEAAPVQGLEAGAAGLDADAARADANAGAALRQEAQGAAGVANAQPNVQGLPGQVGIGQESVPTQPVQEAGAEAVGAGGVLQAQGREAQGAPRVERGEALGQETLQVGQEGPLPGPERQAVGKKPKPEKTVFTAKQAKQFLREAGLPDLVEFYDNAAHKKITPQGEFIIEGRVSAETGAPMLNLAAFKTKEDLIKKAGHELTHIRLMSEQGRKLLREYSHGRMTVAERRRLEVYYPQAKGESDAAYLDRLADEHVTFISENKPTQWQELVQRVKEFLAKTGLRNLSNEEVARSILRAVGKEDLKALTAESKARAAARGARGTERQSIEENPFSDQITETEDAAGGTSVVNEVSGAEVYIPRYSLGADYNIWRAQAMDPASPQWQQFLKDMDILRALGVNKIDAAENAEEIWDRMPKYLTTARLKKREQGPPALLMAKTLEVGKEGSPIRSTSGYFMSFDASGNCTLRLNALGYLNAVVRELEARGMDPSMDSTEREVVLKKLVEAGMPRPCFICYVETRRALQQQYAGALSKFFTGTKLGRGESMKQMKKAELVAIRDKYAGKVRLADVDQTVFIDKEKWNAAMRDPRHNIHQYKDMYEAIRDGANTKASTTFATVAYVGQYRNLTAEIIKRQNMNGGLRFYSISDFYFEHAMDLMQALYDVGQSGGSAHMYTKQPLVARLLAKTGVKINMSINPVINEAGEIVELQGQSFPWEEAKKLRAQYPNLGTVFMAHNDREIEWAKRQDWIDYILPWHQSGMEKAQANEFKAQQGWVNYEGVQSLKWYKANGKVGGKTHINPAFAQEYFKRYGHVDKEVTWKPGWTIQGNAISHQDLVEQTVAEGKKWGFRPPFNDYLYMRDFNPETGKYGKFILDENGERILDEGGAKLLKDYARTDTPQTPVVPDFDRKAFEEALDGFINTPDPVTDIKPQLVDYMVQEIQAFRDAGKPVGQWWKNLVFEQTQLGTKPALSAPFQARIAAAPNVRQIARTQRLDRREAQGLDEAQEQVERQSVRPIFEEADVERLSMKRLLQDIKTDPPKPVKYVKLAPNDRHYEFDYNDGTLRVKAEVVDWKFRRHEVEIDFEFNDSYEKVDTQGMKSLPKLRDISRTVLHEMELRPTTTIYRIEASELEDKANPTARIKSYSSWVKRMYADKLISQMWFEREQDRFGQNTTYIYYTKNPLSEAQIREEWANAVDISTQDLEAPVERQSIGAERYGKKTESSKYIPLAALDAGTSIASPAEVKVYEAALQHVPEGFIADLVELDKSKARFIRFDDITAAHPRVAESYTIADGKIAAHRTNKKGEGQIYHRMDSMTMPGPLRTMHAEITALEESRGALGPFDTSKTPNGWENTWKAQVEAKLGKGAYAQLMKDVEAIRQRHLSALPTDYDPSKTSQNQKPAFFKFVDWVKGTRNFDLGAGKYMVATDFLAEKGVKNLRYDIFNVSPADNRAAFNAIKEKPADTATIANVLNVIREPELRGNVILQAAKAIKPNGTAYFSVYYNSSAKPGMTAIGTWQEQRPMDTYVDEIKKHFGSVTVDKKRGVIVARQPLVANKEATWLFDRKGETGVERLSVKREEDTFFEDDEHGFVAVGGDLVAYDHEGNYDPTIGIGYAAEKIAFTVGDRVGKVLTNKINSSYKTVLIVAYKNMRGSMENNVYYHSALDRALKAAYSPEAYAKIREIAQPQYDAEVAKWTAKNPKKKYAGPSLSHFMMRNQPNKGEPGAIAKKVNYDRVAESIAIKGWQDIAGKVIGVARYKETRTAEPGNLYPVEIVFDNYYALPKPVDYEEIINSSNVPENWKGANNIWNMLRSGVVMLHKRDNPIVAHAMAAGKGSAEALAKVTDGMQQFLPGERQSVKRFDEALDPIDNYTKDTKIQRSDEDIMNAAKGSAEFRGYSDHYNEILNEIFGTHADVFRHFLVLTTQATETKAAFTAAMRLFKDWLDGTPLRHVGARNLNLVLKGEEPTGKAMRPYWLDNFGATHELKIDVHLARYLFGPSYNDKPTGSNNNLPTDAMRAEAQATLERVAGLLTKDTGQVWTPSNVRDALWAANQKIETPNDEVPTWDKLLEDNRAKLEALAERARTHAPEARFKVMLPANVPQPMGPIPTTPFREGLRKLVSTARKPLSPIAALEAVVELGNVHSHIAQALLDFHGEALKKIKFSVVKDNTIDAWYRKSQAAKGADDIGITTGMIDEYGDNDLAGFIVHEVVHSRTQDMIPENLIDYSLTGQDYMDELNRLLDAKSTSAGLKDLIWVYKEALQQKGVPIEVLGNPDDKRVISARGQALLKGQVRYAYTTLGEFVSEAFSNTEFQYELNKMKTAMTVRVSEKGETLWDKFVAAVAKMIGVKVQHGYALDAVFKTASRIIAERPDMEISNWGRQAYGTERQSVAPAGAVGVADWRFKREPTVPERLMYAVTNAVYNNKTIKFALQNFPKESEYYQLSQLLLNHGDPGLLMQPARQAQHKDGTSYYHPTDRAIYIWGPHFHNDHVWMHEILHALTVHKIRGGASYAIAYGANKDAAVYQAKLREAMANPMTGKPIADLIGVYLEAIEGLKVEKRLFGTPKTKGIAGISDASTNYQEWAKQSQSAHYGLMNLEEFISEVYVNRDLQRALNRIQAKDSKVTLWQKFVDSIAKILGIPLKSGSVLEKALRVIGSVVTDDVYVAQRYGAPPAGVSEMAAERQSVKMVHGFNPAEAPDVWWDVIKKTPKTTDVNAARFIFPNGTVIGRAGKLHEEIAGPKYNQLMAAGVVRIRKTGRIIGIETSKKITNEQRDSLMLLAGQVADQNRAQGTAFEVQIDFVNNYGEDDAKVFDGHEVDTMSKAIAWSDNRTRFAAPSARAAGDNRQAPEQLTPEQSLMRDRWEEMADERYSIQGAGVAKSPEERAAFRAAGLSWRDAVKHFMGDRDMTDFFQAALEQEPVWSLNEMFRNELLNQMLEGTLAKTGEERVAAKLPFAAAERRYYDQLRGIVGEDVERMSLAPAPGNPFVWNVDGDASSRYERWSRLFQDKARDSRKVVEAIEKWAGLTLEDKQNPYLLGELYRSRSAEAIRDFSEKDARGLMKKIADAGLKLEDLDEFLHHMHAAERNQHIGRINDEYADTYIKPGDTMPADPDAVGGSGLSFNQIKRYEARIAADPALGAKLQALATDVYKWRDTIQQKLISSGQETAETIDQWNRTYQAYVPLQREEFADELHISSGKGVSGRGQFVRRATGSRGEVFSPVTAMAMAMEKAILREEKARVAQATYELAINAPNADFWMAVDPNKNATVKMQATWRKIMDAYNAMLAGPLPQTAAQQKIIDKLEAEYRQLRREHAQNYPEVLAMLRRMGFNQADAVNVYSEPFTNYVDPNSGLVRQRVNPLLRDRPEVLNVRINGEDKMVIFNFENERAKQMAIGLKNLEMGDLNKFLNFMAKGTRWIAMVNTQYSPIFGLRNVIRDFFTSGLNLSATPLAGKQAQLAWEAAKFLRIKLTPGAKLSAADQALFDEFRAYGGKTAYRSMTESAKEYEENLLKVFAEEKNEGSVVRARKAALAVAKVFEPFNDATETMFRFAAYKLAKDQGLSPEKAALLAKDITVNFDRKGQVSTQIGALNAFFNASAQGSIKTLKTLFNANGSPTAAGAKIIAGGLLLGVAQALMLRASGAGDDDDPKQYEREKNFIIPRGDKKYWKIPMPLGFNILPNIGRIATEAWFNPNPADKAKMVFNLGLVGLDSFSPLGTGNPVQVISPTLVDPLVNIGMNTDWNGRPIYREDMNPRKPTPGFERARDTTTKTAMAVSKFLDWASFGHEGVPGFVSVSPDVIDYLAGYAGGGMMREAIKGAQWVRGKQTGEEVPSYKTPIVGSFSITANDKAMAASKYYENTKQVFEAETVLETRKKARKGIGDLYTEYPEARLIRRLHTVESKISDLKSESKVLKERNAGKELIQRKADQINRLMTGFNEAYERIQEQKMRRQDGR